MGYSNFKLNKRLGEKKNRQRRQLVDKWIFYLLLAVIILVPLLVNGYFTDVQSPTISINSLLASGSKGEFYTHYKFVTMMILTILVVLLFLYKLLFLGYSLPNSRLFLFFGIFLFAILMSVMFSPNKTIALYGLFNRADGTYSYICYILLMFIAMNIEYPKKAVQYVLYAFYPLVIITFILITMNFTGHDALSYGPFVKLVTMFLPDRTSLIDGSYIVGTFNHWNYISGMFSIITLMYISWVIIDNLIIRRIINGVMALLSMATMLMGVSHSGFLTFIVITPFIIWIAIKSFNKKMAIISLVAFYVLSAVMLHFLALKNPNVWDESVGIFINKNPYTNKQPTSTSLNNNSIWKESVLIEHTAYAAENKFTLPVLPEKAWTAGSGRVYIWKETLKLVKNRPLFGYGLDTLIYHFPHYNIQAQANLYDLTIVYKPHSLYVGIIYGTGIIGIIGFLGFMSFFGWKALLEVIRFNQTSGIVVTLCIGWMAYLIQALFNDSLPGITSTLFTIGGIMMANIYKKNGMQGG
jgi:hypothetical protein